MPDPASGAASVNRGERLNVMFVLAVSQLAPDLAMVAIVAALIFFVLGLILLSPELLADMDAQRRQRRHSSWE